MLAFGLIDAVSALTQKGKQKNCLVSVFVSLSFSLLSGVKLSCQVKCWSQLEQVQGEEKGRDEFERKESTCVLTDANFVCACLIHWATDCKELESTGEEYTHFKSVAYTANESLVHLFTCEREKERESNLHLSLLLSPTMHPIVVLLPHSPTGHVAVLFILSLLTKKCHSKGAATRGAAAGKFELFHLFFYSLLRFPLCWFPLQHPAQHLPLPLPVKNTFFYSFLLRRRSRSYRRRRWKWSVHGARNGSCSCHPLPGPSSLLPHLCFSVFPGE